MTFRRMSIRNMYPRMMDEIREATTIETKRMGRIYVGYDMKYRIDTSKKKIKKVS